MKQCKHPTCGETCRRPPQQKKYGHWKSKAAKVATGDKELPFAELLKVAQAQHNLYIRLRDQDMGCISCESRKVEHAGHFHPAGKFSGVRFGDVNTNGQCRYCNVDMNGNLEGYHTGLIARYGAEKIKELEIIASATKMAKWDRDSLSELIQVRKEQIKELNSKKAGSVK